MNLVEINKEKQEAVFENVKSKERHSRPYSNLYSIMPCKPHQSLVESGLATKDSNYLLDVDNQTLRHKKYKNIFGLGDVCNLPTTKTFWAGFYQLHVVRNNVGRSLRNQTLNAHYDGFTKVPLLLGQNTLTYVAHYYDQKEAWHNLLDKNGGPIAIARYYYWGKSQKRKFLGYYLLKSWGPPYHKFKKGFGELPGTPEAEKGTDFTKYIPFVKKHDDKDHGDHAPAKDTH